jgi:hypothetical protein
MDDKLIILEDTNGDGKADKRTVFAGDLNNPTSRVVKLNADPRNYALLVELNTRPHQSGLGSGHADSQIRGDVSHELLAHISHDQDLPQQRRNAADFLAQQT